MKDCNQCGKCCIKYGGSDLAITPNEIDRWEQFHPEIFKYVNNGEIWFDPKSNQKLERCPFLETGPQTSPRTPTKYTCSIYSNRPEDCRSYPSLINEMIRDECEMIEQKDLLNLKDAQKSLDIIMIDSRHANCS